MRFALLSVVLLSASAAAAAQLDARPGGTALFAGEVEPLLTLDRRGATQGDSRVVTLEDAPIARAVELRCRALPPESYDLQLTAKIPAAIRQGDTVWITLWARATQTSGVTRQAFSQVTLTEVAFPYSDIANFDFAVGGDWRQFAWSFVAGHDYEAGESLFCLRGGYAPQALEAGGIRVIDYGREVKPADLPHHKITYLGMEPNAPWRQAAAERIDKYRKADLKVVARDSMNQPLVGATVQIEEQRPAFGFGSCVDARLIEGTDGRLSEGPATDRQRYLDVIKDCYNKVVFESDLKWGYRGDAMWRSWTVDAAEGHKNTLGAMRWLAQQGIQIRGHNLVWPSWKYSPEGLTALKHDPAALEQRVEDHIKDIVGTTRGQFTEWDVVNEPYANHDLLDLLPPDAMARWFKLTHQIDPRPVLFLNDYAGFMQCGEDTRHKQANEKTLRTLKEQGAPIGGYGIQAHFDEELAGPDQLVSELDRWAATGLELQITEFDVNIADEQVQAQYTHDFMTAVFSHPAVNALLSWGFWERADWIPRAAFYRKDWSLRPNGQVWNDLVLKEWRTRLAVATNAAGVAAARCFQGQYRLVVTYRDKTVTVPCTLPKEGAIVPVTVPLL